MKYITYFILSLVLVSCGTDNHRFKIDGRLLHFNQGEFYIYSPDGSTDGVDTIKVDAGRFTYNMSCNSPSILMIVFPNFTEQPIFAEPGKSVNVKGDASHLKELEVKGTKDNKLMNQFRKQVANASPPEAQKFAEQFIKDHPSSIVGRYLITKYFIQQQKPNYKKAYDLVDLMLKSNTKSVELMQLGKQLNSLKNYHSATLPAFTAYDLNGKRISQSYLASAPIAVITLWASWNYQSLSTQRQLKYLQSQHKNKLRLLSVSLDADRSECRRIVKNDSITWPNICDEDLFESQIMHTLGLYSMPDNIILQNGKIIARGLDSETLLERVRKLL